MIILTNGICGSSCSIITQRTCIAEQYNVSTSWRYKDIPLSYASFPGGQVYSLIDLIVELENLGLFICRFNSFSILIRADLSFTLKELYDVDNPDNVLEFV